jgi:hypothetical protein
MADRPFPTLHRAGAAASPQENPNGYRSFALPSEQAEFDDWARELGLYRQGQRRWKNLDSRNSCRLQFQLDRPMHLGATLHRVVRDPMAPGGERSLDLWPASQRAVRIVVASASEVVLPELWSGAILVVDDAGVIRGGQAPASLRPIGVPPAELDVGLAHLTPEPGPEAA